MADRRRSPFGELVHAYRTRMNLTQEQLANRANAPAHPRPDQGTVSLRTISSIEKRYLNESIKIDVYVPEPCTIGLVLLGVMGWTFRRR